MSFGSDVFKLAFELSPIMLTGGVADLIPGGMLPIISVTQSVDFLAGLLGGQDVTNFDNFFAHFQPLPGGTLIEQDIGKYPFANQAVAANATIQQPLTLSMLMICPAQGVFAYGTKLVTMMALQAVLSQHNRRGGTYTVITPSYFYTNMILRRMSDASSGQSKQPQNAWQMDFEQPLLTLSEAQSVQNSLMSKISGGTQIEGQPAWSGTTPTVGAPNSIAAPGVIPAASGLPSANTSPLSGLPGNSAGLG